MIEHIKDLTPDPNNARRHNARNVGMIERSLEEVGAARSIVIDEDGVILAGNATTEAAAQAGITRVRVVEADGNEIIAVQRRGLTPEQKIKLALADNRAAEMAEWEPDVLAELAREVDVSALFFPDELAELSMPSLPEAGAGGDDFDPTPDDGPTRAQLGDLWIIGGVHRLLVGDCTDPANVARLMGGERAVAGIMDPPYGINIVGGNHTAGNFPGTSAPRLKAVPIVGDDKPFDPAHLLDAADILVLWGANHYADKLPASSKWLIWDKKDGAFRESDLGDCELAWTNQKGAARLLHHTWQGMYRKGEGERAPRVHPTQKPVDLIEWCMSQCGVPDGAIVTDWYLGSGTTLIAAHRTGRRCYGMEISERYADVILRRAEAEGLTVERAESIAIPSK